MILLLQALHTFKVDTNFELFSILCIPTYMEGWLLLHVSLELLSVCVIAFFFVFQDCSYILVSYLSCQLLCSWRERKLREKLWRSQLRSILCDYLEQWQAMLVIAIVTCLHTGNRFKLLINTVHKNLDKSSNFFC